MNEYTFYKGNDYNSCDIRCVGKKSVDELMKICNEDDNCVGFNTFGYLKYFIGDKSTFFKPNCFTDEDGLYVKNKSVTDKKVICFYVGYALMDKELYGSELALINIAKLFSNEYSVYLVGVLEASTIKHGLKYLNVVDYHNFQKVNKIDVLIIVRYINYFVECELTASKTYIWLHDRCMNPFWKTKEFTNCGHFLITNMDNKINGYICLSEWHKELIRNNYNLKNEKMHIIGNAVSNDTNIIINNITKIKNRFIYISAPNRGLNKAVEYVDIIKRTITDATFYIFRGEQEFDSPELKQLLEYINQTKYIHFGGSITNEQVMIELAKSDVWFYPTNSTESFCTSALEAMACGCLCVTTDLSSPSTLIADRGVLLQSDIYSSEYKNECVNKVINILLDDTTKHTYQNKAKSWALGQTWSLRYLQWKSLLFD